MNTQVSGLRANPWRHAIRRCAAAALALPFLLPLNAHASLFKGEALDKVADVMTWVVLVIAPVIAIGVFLMVHILPEKIAEKKQHPQTKAIQCLCLLSLFFGGLLWPLAWLWAYTKPVLHQMAYGTDKEPHEPVSVAQPVVAQPVVVQPAVAQVVDKKDDAAEVAQLRQRIAELETKLAGVAAAPVVKG